MLILNSRKRASLLGLIFLALSQWCIASDTQRSSASQLYQSSLAATCANCHGTDGKGIPNGGMPLIDHMSNEQMREELLAYKSGAKPGTIMPQLCKGYTDDQLATIAQQLGTKSTVRP